MATAQIMTPLKYPTDPLELFDRLRKRPGAVLLDSGRPLASGRYDIITSDPLGLLETFADGHSRLTGDSLPPLPQPLMSDSFALQQWLLEQLDIRPPDTSLPFTSGLMGYWGYDLGRDAQEVPSKRPRPAPLPSARIGLYDWAIVIDHWLETATLVASEARRRQVLEWLEVPPPSAEPFTLNSAFTAELARHDYLERFERVMDYIRAGDCYQINLAQRFSATYQGDEWLAYQRLRMATPTPFAGYMAWDGQAVMSLSPERFIQASEGADVETRPIKGTRPRGETQEEDLAFAKALQSSDKDRAENVMIVDLLRNDLGRVCQPGSIQVPKLCQLESYPNVHHLVSVVRGRLTHHHSPLALLKAAFPGGSITGAPKIRAMQIIDELEPCQRSVYCGSLGYVDLRGNMDTSIAIRTVLADHGTLHLWGGGGLVADSDGDAEYAETYAKIRHLIQALGAS